KLVLCPAEFDGDVPALDVASFVQPFPESRQETCLSFGRTKAEISNHRHLRLLRARRERPCRRAAKQRYEVAAFHSMASSARPSSVIGKVRPSTFAVLRLMTSSTFTACITGRSTGFAPLRIFPV